MSKTKASLLTLLTSLTCLFVLTQIVFTWISFQTSDIIDSLVSSSITLQVFRLPIFIQGVTQFFVSQVLIYSALVYLLWYITTGIAELFRFNQNKTYYLGLVIWLLSIIFILSANTYYVPFSFYAGLVRDSLFQHYLTPLQFKLIADISASLLSIAIVLACVNLAKSIYQQINLIRHINALVFLTVILSILVFNQYTAQAVPLSVATEKQPNVIIIGLDAARRDSLGPNNKQNVQTPHINSFLSTAIQFENPYTTLARTFPSWSSILTSTYPLHNRVRGNNTDLSLIHIDDTLPKQLKRAGYETIYGTDDTRFNNTNELFGFDQIISPPMGVNDFLLGTLNDFPLSNLLIPTALGKWLFPYNFANHGTAMTYRPDNFLELIRDKLHQREDKPLFLAVHFTMTHWPFYWFNDKQHLGISIMERYRLSMQGADQQFNQFMQLLADNHLLEHSIVILLSDHGIAMGLPGDRLVSPNHYQGAPENIKKVSYAKYSTEALHNTLGIDTGYGYGGDLLTLESYHTVLAFKGFGVNLGSSHTVFDRVSVLDIAPTLLALLHLPALKESDGMSLAEYFAHPELTAKNHRPFFLETTFSPEEIQKENISAQEVLQKSIQLYQVAPKTGLVSVKSSAEAMMNKDKQFGILQDNWLLVRYPRSTRMRLVLSKNPVTTQSFENYTVPAYYVLLDLNTGSWTTELNTPFALASPVKNLLSELSGFYGNEMGKV